MSKYAGYAVGGVFAGSSGDFTNQALYKGIENVNYNEVLISGAVGGVVAPVSAKVIQGLEKIDKNQYNIELKYKEDWNATQRLEAYKKVQKLSNSKTIKTVVNRQKVSASKVFKKFNGFDSVPNGCDVDHIVDLQLGGNDNILNMSPLDSSVNKSLGIQIHNKIKYYPYGTKFKKFSIK